MDHIFIHSSVDERLCCPHVLAIVSSTAALFSNVNIYYMPETPSFSSFKHARNLQERRTRVGKTLSSWMCAQFWIPFFNPVQTRPQLCPFPLIFFLVFRLPCLWSLSVSFLFLFSVLPSAVTLKFANLMPSISTVYSHFSPLLHERVSLINTFYSYGFPIFLLIWDDLCRMHCLSDEETFTRVLWFLSISFHLFIYFLFWK